MGRKVKEEGFWKFVENFKGDKVIWMIVLLLMMFSILSVFSSTSLLAIQQKTTRISIVKEQFIIVAAGLAIIGICYFIRNIKVFEWLSQWGFLLSLTLLVILNAHLNLGFISAQKINDAWRNLSFLGLQIHVYEVVKIAMILYLAWAVNAFKDDSFALANFFSTRFPRLAFLAEPFWKKLIYIYMPVLVVTALILRDGTSSALFIGGMMILTIFIGGVNLKEIAGLAAIGIVYIALSFVLYEKTEGRINLSNRTSTAMHRLREHKKSGDKMDILLTAPRNSKQFQDALDDLKQPVSALVAIQEGGVLGKGPGQSTQRYVVPVLFGDYMFSFIVEEYGLWGALIIIILYASLLSRGALLAKNCDNYYAKVVLAGLVLTISCQAFMHMAINVHLVPQTGQTLPMISHGASSFLAFSVGFGVILSISRMLHTKVQKAIDAAEPIRVQNEDEVRDTLSDLENMETEDYDV